jgi:hypothetical protein
MLRASGRQALSAEHIGVNEGQAPAEGQGLSPTVEHSEERGARLRGADPQADRAEGHRRASRGYITIRYLCQRRKPGFTAWPPFLRINHNVSSGLADLQKLYQLNLENPSWQGPPDRTMRVSCTPETQGSWVIGLLFALV